MRWSCMTRQARRGLTSLPPFWRPTGQLRGAVAMTHTANCFRVSTTLAIAPAVNRRRLLFILISAMLGSLSVERGEPFALTTVS